MKLKFINNYVYKGNWNNLLYYKYTIDFLHNKHILIGILGLFLFITYK